jgi:uncharacterized membrane protein YfcA
MSEPLSWIATFAVGFAATFVFVTTGGVGMVTIPALIFLGLTPQAAVATDIFALLGGRLGGLLGLLRGEKVDVALGLRLGAATAVGAVAGAFALLSLPEELARQVLAAVLLVLLALLLLRPRVGVETRQPVSAARRWLGTLLFVPIGFWSTLIGAGFLNLGSAVLLFVLRKTFLETAGVLTIVGLAVALTGSVIFGSNDAIVWGLGVAMLLGKAAGGYLGARYAVKLGEQRVRWLFAAVVLLSALRLYSG